LRQVVQGQGGFLFLPVIYSLAARLEQIDWEEMSDDAASAAYALRAAQKLFQLPAIVSHFRLGVEAEACGGGPLGREDAGISTQIAARADPGLLDAGVLQRGRLAVVLDVTQRLVAELDGQASVVAVVTGPRTLTSLFSAEPAAGGLADFYALLGRAYAERGAQLLLIVEAASVALAPSSPSAALTPLLNVARYFRIPTVLLDAQARQQPAGFDLLVGGAGLPLLPVERLREPPSDARAWQQKSKPLLVTDGEIPPDQPAEQLLEWITAMRAPGS